MQEVPNERYGMPLTESERRGVLAFRGAAYVLLLLYLFVLVANGVAIASAFVARALNILPSVEWPFLAAWAGGTAGLGAGSFIFGRVLDFMFGIGR